MIDYVKETLLININIITIRSNQIDKDLGKLYNINLLRIACNCKIITIFSSKFKSKNPELILFYSELLDGFDPRN